MQAARIAMILVAHGLLARPAPAAEAIKPTLDVQDVLVTVRYVSTGELAQLRLKYGGMIDLRDVRQDDLRGFSVVKRNRATGARTCEIYLPKVGRPQKVNDAGTLTLGHELLHCLLGDYHR